MSVYPNGVAPLATEQEGFREQGWTCVSAQPRSANHLGISCFPFLSVGCVDKKGTETKRVVTDCGFPHDDFWLSKCKGGKLFRTSLKYVAPNVRHGPKRPSPGTPIRLAGDAPNPRETKPPFSEAAHNTSIIINGARACNLWIFEILWDYAKAFHQFRLTTEMLTQMGGIIVPTYDPNGSIAENLVPVMKAVMAMGWRPASNFLHRGR